MGRVWYDKAAEIWEEAIPLGNGRLGAMVFGKPYQERIQVNEESIWYGGPVDRNNPDTLENLPKIRELFFGGKIKEGEHLLREAMSGCPCGMHPYQTLGDINLYFPNLGDVTDYVRELDMNTAVSKVTYVAAGTRFQREIFISKPADLMVVRFTKQGEQKISFTAELHRDHYFDGCRKTSDTEIALWGNLGKDGFDYVMKLTGECKGGKLYTLGEHLIVEEADEVILYFTADCSFHELEKAKKNAGQNGEVSKTADQNAETSKNAGQNAEASKNAGQNGAGQAEATCKAVDIAKDMQPILAENIRKIFEAAKAEGYNQLLADHVADYKALYDRCELTLPADPEREKIPTNERISGYQEGKKDEGLIKLYFDFGRYLMIACSREGGLPSTLQGLWNKDLTPPWESKYTININTEMNYWPAENCNLSECHMPLFDHIERMVQNGRKTAKVMYGCRGFVAHHNTDIHGDTAPQDKWIPGTYWVMGAAWLCTHQWTHYQYTKDIQFLQRTFPVMAEAALFFLDFLVDYKGYLVTCPSVSPENTYILPSGEMGANGFGVTMDNQILRDLFTQCMEAYDILQKADALSKEVLEKCQEAQIPDVESFRGEIEKACKRLIPTQISESGRIMEWQEDYKEWEPGHRHISHLYGLHPSWQITMDGTPDLAEAAKKTLEGRLSQGGGHTGWSRAWIINHYAKLWDGESAHYNIEQLLEKSTYPNMFDKHPPFQIDGNFGTTAAILEMLVQSNQDRIVLLPALPTQWSQGSLKGCKVVGNGEMTITWENNKLQSAKLTAVEDLDTDCLYQGKKMHISLKKGETLEISEEAFA